MKRIAILALVAACSTPAATTTTAAPTTTTLATETIAGTFTLTNPQVRPPTEPCVGEEGFDDIQEGAQVVIRDGDGTTIANSALGPGEATSDSTGPGSLWYCVFAFSVEVPAGEPFYSVEVSHRGEVTYSAEEMEAADWVVSLELG